ncbi:MAG TPA: KpsF/GutQ family sugar-phosphate isomerase [Planctomycetaceae bacterium]|nr:KpsF/GutQ family sugar-phosphate isomerase [Planctomycetaceae bacterium]
MSASHEASFVPYSQFEQLREAREILRQEAQAIESVAQQLDTAFCAAVELLSECRGKVVVTGMGKAGIIGRKLAATLASTGTRAHYMHPAEAVHGDLGMLHPEDVVLVLSNSGETEEVVRLLPTLNEWGIAIVAITGREHSTLGTHAQVTLSIGRVREAGQFGLAPTASTTAMLAIGDALALVVSRVRGFTPQGFARFHPAGSLGRQSQSVREVMRHGEQLRIALEDATVREVFAQRGKPGRRTGAVILVDGDGRLSGLFTDSDLARLLEGRRESQLDRPICEVMTRQPCTISVDALLAQAVEILSSHHWSELPVVDADGCPVGLVDITDVIGLLPAESD